MKLTAFSALLSGLGLAGACAAADPTDATIVAAMKLSEYPDYSWTTTIKRDNRTLTMDGKTDGSSYALVTFGGYASSTGGRSTGASGDVDAVFMGDSSYVVDTSSGWVTPNTSPAPSAASEAEGGNGGNGGYGGRGGGGGMGGLNLGGLSIGGGRRNGGGGSGGRSSRNSSSQGSDSGGGAPRLPAGINMPHEELSIIVSNYSTLHVDGDIASGDLTESGADLLLVPPGSSALPPEGAAGTFRLWIDHGAVTKYELHLSAKTAPDGRTPRGGFSETVTVELKDVAKTVIDVPDAAKQKLGI